MGWDRESNEEYDDGYTRESFERADEDTGDEEPEGQECRFCGGGARSRRSSTTRGEHREQN